MLWVLTRIASLIKHMLWVLIRILMNTHNICSEAILMSTHNICFYGEMTKIILQLSSNTHIMCSSVVTPYVKTSDLMQKKRQWSGTYVRMCKLICAFVVRIWDKHGPYTIKFHILTREQPKGNLSLQHLCELAQMLTTTIIKINWAASSEFVSSSILSWPGLQKFWNSNRSARPMTSST